MILKYKALLWLIDCVLLIFDRSLIIDVDQPDRLKINSAAMSYRNSSEHL